MGFPLHASVHLASLQASLARIISRVAPRSPHGLMAWHLAPCYAGLFCFFLAPRSSTSSRQLLVVGGPVDQSLAARSLAARSLSLAARSLAACLLATRSLAACLLAVQLLAALDRSCCLAVTGRSLPDHFSRLSSFSHLAFASLSCLPLSRLTARSHLTVIVVFPVFLNTRDVRVATRTSRESPSIPGGYSP